MNVLLKIKDVCRPDRKTIFAGTTLLGAIACIIFCSCPLWIITCALMAALFVFTRADMADVPFYDGRLKLGCACMEVCIVTASCFFCALNVDGVIVYSLGVPVACVLSIIFYFFSPKIFSKLGLIELSPLDRKFNRGLSMCWFYAVMLFFILCIDGSRSDDMQFFRERFIPVTKWRTEIQHGNTYYILYCSKGIIRVSSSEHPEIRNINSRTKIKFLAAPSNSEGQPLCVRRLEIKN